MTFPNLRRSGGCERDRAGASPCGRPMRSAAGIAIWRAAKLLGGHFTHQDASKACGLNSVKTSQVLQQMLSTGRIRRGKDRSSYRLTGTV